MKIVTFEDIVNLNISPVTCYEWVSEMIKAKTEALLPPKISMKTVEGGFCNVMPSIVGDRMGVKTVTRYPDRVPSLESFLFLSDSNTGENLALMDATWITAMRTGAVAAHSIITLAKKDFETVAMVGLGNTARAALLILLSVLNTKKIHVKLMAYKSQENLFIERFKEFDNVTFSVVSSAEELIKHSDVIISAATFMSSDIGTDEMYDEGVLVVPIHTRGFSNCDLFFDKVFADDYGHVCHFKYFDKFKKFAEMTDVVCGKTPGRESDKERILAYNIGVSLHDIYFASKIYEMIKSGSDLKTVDLKTPTEKFWI